jgi:hypothetical protein
VLEEQLAAGRADLDRERAAFADQVAALQEQMHALHADLDRERSRADQTEGRANRAEQRADDALARADHVEVRSEVERERAEAAGIQIELLKRLLREAETGLTAAEAAQLRQAMEQAVREAEALRAAEVARAAAQAMEPTDRPAMVASKIDEVQFRRLQEAEQARKSLGLVVRLRAAWRGE